METHEASASISVVPSGKTLGAEIVGMNAAGGLDEASAAIVRKALDDYGVVVLRGQRLEPKDQVAFSAMLGKLRVSFLSDMTVPGAPELMVVSNIVRDGKPIGLVDAGALWHTDGSYLPRPDMYTVLYALQVPERDGRTLGPTAFLSAVHAYETLPDDLRAQVEGARAVHSWSHHIRRKQETGFKAPPKADDKPDVEHPVVRIHPHTGRKCLFVTEGHTKAIVGMPQAQSDELLQRLFAHIKRPEGIHRHEWQVGDLLIWDNCSTQHLAITDYGDLPRKLHRAGVEGPVPV